LLLLQITNGFKNSSSSSSDNSRNKIRTKNSSSNTNSVVSSSSLFWRSVFPGVFTALYQQTIVDYGFYSSSSSSSLPSIVIPCQNLSLQCLVILLRVSLCSSLSSQDSGNGSGLNDDKYNDNDKANNDNRHHNDGVATTNTKSNNHHRNINNEDLLLRLTSMAATANINANNDGQNDDIENENENKQYQQKQRLPSLPMKKNQVTVAINSNDNNNDDGNEFFSFLCQVRKRIVAPTIILLRQMSISSSDNIRKQVSILCRVILIETPSYCWRQHIQQISPSSHNDDDVENNGRYSGTTIDGSSSIIMERIPFEICVALQRDPEKNIRTSARENINEYLEIHYGGGSGSGKKEVRERSSSDPSSLSSSHWMVSRIIELVQKLSTLVQGSNNNKINNKEPLRTELNLLDGYLTCLVNNNYNKKDNYKGNGNKESNDTIRSALISSSNFRRSLIQLFDVDLDSANNRKLKPVVIMTENIHQVSSVIQLRYLDLDLASLGRNILRTLGKLLGAKYGAIFVDEIVSDFIEASFQMPTYHHSSDNSYTGWIHEWVGNLCVAREVLLGSFYTTNEDQQQQQQQQTNGSTKKEKRSSRILKSLASSILPLLVDSSPWNLRTENRLATVTTLPLHILQRNTVVVILLLELIGTFCGVLRCDVEGFLSTILYPVVDKTSHGSTCLAVQNSGLSILRVMSLSCGFLSIEDLINGEHNQLVSSMVGRLRLPGGSRIPNRNDAEEIMSVINTTRWTIEKITKIEKRGNEERSYSRGGKSSVVDLVSLIDYRLDHLFRQKVLVDIDVETICSLHKVFFSYFLTLLGVKRDVTYSYQMKNIEKDPKQPWLNELSKFRKVPAINSSMISNTKNIECVEEEEADGGERRGRLLDVTKDDISLFSKLIARDCYLLSYKKLDSRISACDALTIAFKFLAFVGSEYDDPSDDRNVIRNSVLRQIADSWPSIRARLKTLSEEILISKRCNSSVVLFLNNNNCRSANNDGRYNTNKLGTTHDVGTQRIFLTQLFALVATMCECSGDFFAERFRNDVWPVMACHLEDLLKQLQRQQQRQPYVDSTAGTIIGTPQQQNAHSTSTIVSIEDSRQSISTKIRDVTSSASVLRSLETRGSFRLSDTERQLIIAILTCLNRVFQQEDCGKAVHNVLGSIGFTLLPLLDDALEDDLKIQEITMDCLKNILRIDCDILRKPLMELSFTIMPCCPLLDFRNNQGSEDDNIGDEETSNSSQKVIKTSLLTTRSTRNRNLVTRCKELLDFVEKLPEQSLS